MSSSTSYAHGGVETPSQEMSVLPHEQGGLAYAPANDQKLSDSLDSSDFKTSDDKLAPNGGREESFDVESNNNELTQYKKRLPAIQWSDGVGPFFGSVGRRLRAIFTPRLLLCIVAGQLLSLCITCTSVVTTELSIGAWALPATQTFFVYFALMLIYTPLTIYKYGVPAWLSMLKTDGWKYSILASIDVFGNFVTVFGFQYTNLLSCMLIGAWSTPVSMLVCFILLRARYHWTQLLGVCICIGGLSVLVVSDLRTDKDWGSSNKVKGDLFMLLGATLYGLSNGGEEYLVRGRPHYEVVGMLGFFGFIINGILVGGYEHASVYESDWTGRNVGLLIAYISAMVILYSVAPLLFRFASAPFYNLSLMTSDFYSLLFGLFLFHYRPYYLYFVAYPMVVCGLIVYNLIKPLDAHAKIDVKPRGKQLVKENESGKARVIGAPTGGVGSIL